jgi:hypothetical protein
MKERYQAQYQRGEITQSEMRNKMRKGFAVHGQVGSGEVEQAIKRLHSAGEALCHSGL